MGIKRRKLRGRVSARLASLLLAFVSAAGMIFTAPGLGKEAKAVDFTKKCSLTVEPGSEELVEDIANADVVVDLYKVADAVPVSGYDAYDFDFQGGYQGVKAIYSENPKSADWARMAQEAAGYVLDNKAVPLKSEAVNETIGELDWGLYLVIARGRDLTEVEDYRTTVRQEDGTQAIATAAHSERYVYTYAPELVALPGRHAVGEDGGTVNTTAGNGAWETDMRVTLKPMQSLRYGSLEIVKTLESYQYNEGSANREPAGFVFQVEAELNGENVRSTVVSLSFTEAGRKSAVVDRIPVGAVVTVTEVYSGATYHATSDTVQVSAPIEAAEIVSVGFSNDYSETNRGGGSVTNHFVYDEEASGWNWTQVPDNSGNIE